MLKREEKSKKLGSMVATAAGERAQKPVCWESKQAESRSSSTFSCNLFENVDGTKRKIVKKKQQKSFETWVKRELFFSCCDA